MTTPEDQAAKTSFIEDFFDDLADKAAFTAKLYRENRRDEARLLVCVYLEAIGNGIYHPSGKYAANFCRLLMEHSGVPIFSVVLPHWLLTRLPWGSASQAVAAELQALLMPLPPKDGFTYHELLDRGRSHLSRPAFAFLEREAWVATTSQVMYSEFRSSGVHWFGSPGGILFSESTWEGRPLGSIGFVDLHAALDNIVASVRGLSVSSGLWFGNPEVVP